MQVTRLLLLSGAIGAGKTAVANVLKDANGFSGISSGAYLRACLERQGDAGLRQNLQNLGDRLDIATDYSWIVNEVALTAIEANPGIENWLLDAVRKPRQIEHFRARFGNAVRHLHLGAPEEVLQSRYEARAKPGDSSYATVIQHPNEVAARSLSSLADRVFDTSSTTAVEIAAHIFFSWER